MRPRPGIRPKELENIIYDLKPKSSFLYKLKIIFSFSLKTYDCFKLSSILSSSSTSLIHAESRVLDDLDDLDDLESLLLKNNFATKEVGPKTKKYIRTSTKVVKYFLNST